MEFKNGVENKLERKFIVKLYELLSRVNGLSINDFQMDLGGQEFNINIYIIRYKPNPNYSFEFQLSDKSSINLYNAKFNPVGTKGILEGVSALMELLTYVESWVVEISTEKEELEYFKRITNPTQLDDNGKILSEDKPFSQNEFEALKNKIDGLEKTLFQTTGLTLEAVEELKKMVNEILDKAKSPSTTKSDLEDTILVKGFKKVRDHVGDEVFNYVTKEVIKEILSVFNTYNIKTLPPFFNNLLSN